MIYGARADVYGRINAAVLYLPKSHWQSRDDKRTITSTERCFRSACLSVGLSLGAYEQAFTMLHPVNYSTFTGKTGKIHRTRYNTTNPNN